jgi:DNA-binding transcriptional MerR regulator
MTPTLDVADLPLTVGQVAHRLGVTAWQVRRCFQRGFLPEPRRMGPYRVIAEADLQWVQAALRAAGYLPPAEGPDDA